MKKYVRLPLYGQLKQHVSYSELSLFNECQWKWLLTKVYNAAPEDEGSLALAYGSAVHAGMEILYSAEVPCIEDAVRDAEKLFVERTEKLTLDENQQLEWQRLKDLLPNLFRDCLANPDLQGIKPLKAELALYESINRTDGLDVKFKGFIDLIFVKKLKRKTVIYIADFKTCSWGWPAEKYQEISVIAQILLYKHFFIKLTGADPKNVTAAYILLKKLPRKGDTSVEVAKISSGPKMMQKAIDYLQDSITMMHSGIYLQNEQSCIKTWKDKQTGLEKQAKCVFFETNDCSASVAKCGNI